MVTPLSITRHPMQEGTLVTLLTRARRLIVLIAVDVGRVVEALVTALDGLPAALILEVPVETRKRPVLSAFVLQELRTLIHSIN